jgi:SOUL heme-binding protein
LRAEPARSVAAIRYTGFWSRSRYEVHERRLREWIKRRGLEPIRAPVWARYDPPFMPWFLRRNEVLIEVREPGSAMPGE